MSNKLQSPNTNKIFRLERCKALTDGVFAIVVTLLVLGIDVPSDHSFSEDGLIAFLERIGFHLFIYGVSFWLAATYWLQHSAIMEYYRHGNRTVIWLNLLFLFPVTLLPFVTELKGAYRHEPLVTLIFGLLQILIGFALILLWNYAGSHPQLLARSVDNKTSRKVALRMLISPVLISVIAIAVSFINAPLSSLFFLSIPLYYLSHCEMDQPWDDSENKPE